MGRKVIGGLGAPGAMYGAPAEPTCLRHRAGAPVGGDGGATPASDRPRRAGARVIQQPVEPAREKPTAPLVDRLLGQPKFVRHGGVGPAGRTAQPRIRRARPTAGAVFTRPQPAFQRLAFGVGARQRRNRSARAHHGVLTSIVRERSLRIPQCQVSASYFP